MSLILHEMNITKAALIFTVLGHVLATHIIIIILCLKMTILLFGNVNTTLGSSYRQFLPTNCAMIVSRKWLIDPRINGAPNNQAQNTQNQCNHHERVHLSSWRGHFFRRSMCVRACFCSFCSYVCEKMGDELYFMFSSPCVSTQGDFLTSRGLLKIMSHEPRSIFVSPFLVPERDTGSTYSSDIMGTFQLPNPMFVAYTYMGIVEVDFFYIRKRDS